MTQAKKVKMVFCFHSVRSKLAIPPASHWPAEKFRDQFEEFLTVDPGWFERWVESMSHLSSSHYRMTATFDDAFQDCIVPAIRCAAAGIRTIVFVPTGHVGQIFPYAPYPVVTEDEIRFLEENGVEIGSHGHTHRDWTTMSLLCLSRELRLSRDFLEEVTRKACNLVAPPHGKFTMEQGLSLLEMGFNAIYGTNLGPVGSDSRFIFRNLANENGYVDAYGKEIPWNEERIRCT